MVAMRSLYSPSPDLSALGLDAGLGAGGAARSMLLPAEACFFAMAGLAGSVFVVSPLGCVLALAASDLGLSVADFAAPDGGLSLSAGALGLVGLGGVCSESAVACFSAACALGAVLWTVSPLLADAAGFFAGSVVGALPVS